MLTGPIIGSFFEYAVRTAADLTNDLGRSIQKAQRPGTIVGAAPFPGAPGGEVPWRPVFRGHTASSRGSWQRAGGVWPPPLVRTYLYLFKQILHPPPRDSVSSNIDRSLCSTKKKIDSFPAYTYAGYSTSCKQLAEICFFPKGR